MFPKMRLSANLSENNINSAFQINANLQKNISVTKEKPFKIHLKTVIHIYIVFYMQSKGEQIKVIAFFTIICG